MAAPPFPGPPSSHGGGFGASPHPGPPSHGDGAGARPSASDTGFAAGSGTDGGPGESAARIRMRGRLFDGATLFGILGAFALMAIAMLWEGDPVSFLNPASFLIVFGGTFLITSASFTWGDIGRTFGDLGNVVSYRRLDPRAAAQDILRIADFARRHGVLRIQGAILSSIKSEPFLYKGLELVIDGVAEQDVETILRREADAAGKRHAKTAGVLRRAAETSPAMGLIGTLIGLVKMLEQLDDPSSIGPGMAVALLTTFYGAILANMVFTPLASKLERNAQEERLVHQVYLLGVLSIGRKDNPRRLEMQLNSALPPEMRVDVFD